MQLAAQGACPPCWPFVPDEARVVTYDYGNWAVYWVGRITGSGFAAVW